MFCTSIVRTMVRRKVTLRLDAGVVQNAKGADMNLSYFLEVKLVEYLAMLKAPRGRFELSLPECRTGSQGQQKIKHSFYCTNYIFFINQYFKRFLFLFFGLNTLYLKSFQQIIS